MPWSEPHGWEERGDELEKPTSRRWPLDWRGLYPRERWLWFEQLWSDVCVLVLRERYRPPIRCDWWEDHIQVEALAAVSARVDRYDSGEWDDPPGKLSLLFDLERVATLLKDGSEPFCPEPRPDRVRPLADRSGRPAPTGDREPVRSSAPLRLGSGG